MKVNKLISSVCLFRVQTLTSSTNPRTRCPAGSISLWPLMTPCPCRRMPTHHVCPLWTSPLLKCQGPKSLLDCDAAVSASPPSPSTWRPPQRCRRSRGMFLTLSCQAARTPTPQRQRLVLFSDGTAIRSPLCYFLLPPLKPCPSCSDAAVERGMPCLHATEGAECLLLRTYKNLQRPHRLLCSSVPSHPRSCAMKRLFLPSRVGQL